MERYVTESLHSAVENTGLQVFCEVSVVKQGPAHLWESWRELLPPGPATPCDPWGENQWMGDGSVFSYSSVKSSQKSAGGGEFGII